ncbi:MAG: GGDEF domain-containing protein [Gammaproteobacteria bacterium]|nr:GGDEF domain-containing protein [Gammaproteobacteria bacterium]
MTELANRRYFDAYLADEISRAQRTKKEMALIMCDVDFFKPYNDYYGHQAGDQCLRQVATAIESCCRHAADLAARYGGEEFALILPETELSGAVQVAEEVRNTVAQLRLAHARSKVASYVSISAAVVVYRPGTDMTADQLVAAADAALYQAKHLGRNRVVAPQQLTT